MGGRQFETATRIVQSISPMAMTALGLKKRSPFSRPACGPLASVSCASPHRADAHSGYRCIAMSTAVSIPWGSITTAFFPQAAPQFLHAQVSPNCWLISFW